jgi:hypothetical protein
VGATINIQKLWDQRYRDESVPFPVDGSSSDLPAPTGNAVTDTANIQAALANISAGGVIRGPGKLVGPYVINQTLTMKAGMSWNSCYFQLAAGANVDLVKTQNFDALTGGTASGTVYDFSLVDCVLDHNDVNNTAGWAMKIFGARYNVSRTTFHGSVWSEWYDDGTQNDMESHWSDWKIKDWSNSFGEGLHWAGPHDSQHTNGIVSTLLHQPSDIPTSAIRTYGAQALPTPGRDSGGEWTNVHAWGRLAGWAIRDTTGAKWTNCVAEGALVNVLLESSGTVWDGEVYGTNGGGSLPGQSAEVGIQIGSADWAVSRCKISAFIHTYASGGFPLDFNDSGGDNVVECRVQAGTTTSLYKTAPPNNDWLQIQCHDVPARTKFQVPYFAPSVASVAPGTLRLEPDTLVINIPSKANGRVLTSDASGGATWQAGGGTVAPGTWTALTLGTNITATATFNTPSAALLGANLVLLSGCITTTGVIGANATILTLPSSPMFPATKLRFVLGDSNSNATPAACSTSGVITSVSGLASGVTVGLDGIILRLN